MQMALLVVGLKRRIGTIRAREVGGSMARTLGASAVAAVCGWGAAEATAPIAIGKLTRMMPGVLGAVAFGLAFVAAAHVFGSEEQRLLLAGVKRRLTRKR